MADRPVNHRVRSSLSESSNSAGDVSEVHDSWARSRAKRNLYGAHQNSQFGPKACILKSQDATLTIQNPARQFLSWSKPPENVLVIKKIWDTTLDESFVLLITWLIQDKGLKVFLEKNLKEDNDFVSNPNFLSISKKLEFFDMDKHDMEGLIDLVICAGGDGTLLYASSLFQNSVPPVMAFNFGSLGFLLPFEFSEFKKKIDFVLRGDNVGLVLRSRLIALISSNVLEGSKPWSINRMEEQDHYLVLNEVVVDRGDMPYLCQLNLYIDDMLVTVVQGDGLIISTPTGSTAYSAAAGASMVHPNVPAVVIAPICPHSLSFRPIIIPAGVEIKITVSPDARDGAWASFDGRQRQKLQKSDVLVINSAKHPLPSISNVDPIADWFDRLASCFHWNVRKHQLPFQMKSPDKDPCHKSRLGSTTEEQRPDLNLSNGDM